MAEEEKNLKRKALRLRGLRQRWIFNTVLPVLVLLILFSGRIVTPAAESSLFPVSRHKPNEYFVLCLHFPVRDPIMKATYLRRARGGIAMRSF